MNLKKSLQSIKNAIVKNEETIKILQKNHPHLTHLSKKQILNYFNVNSILELNEHIKQIEESQDHYDNHEVKENEICSCADSNGQPKDLYNSEVSAQEQAHKLSRQKRVQLSVYICPDGCGWHLTKR